MSPINPENPENPSDQDTLLIVDDNPTNLDVLFNFLKSTGFKVLVARDGERGLQKLDYARVDLILLDVMMPIMDGFEVCRRLKQDLEKQEIPVIFMTALTDTLDKVKGFELGAADYITKPIDQDETLARIKTHLHLHKLQRQLAVRNRELEEKTQSLENLMQALAKAKDAAEEANRAKSAFLASMSHELRTPMNAIIGYSEMLKEEAADLEEPEFSQDLTKINASGKHLLSLINDVLDYSKIEAGKMELFRETFAVRPMLDEVIATVHPLVEKNHNQFALEAPDNLGELHADATKVRQILINLISNACKFARDQAVIVTASLERDRLRFEVRDQGIGMTPDQQTKLFKAFSQTDASISNRFGGTGLGLNISKRYAEMMGGDILVKSASGEGSTFTLILPLKTNND